MELAITKPTKSSARGAQKRKRKVPKIDMRPIAEIKPNRRNAQRHSPRQIGQLKQSMIAFGVTTPILVDDSGEIIAGHGRLESMH